MVYAGAAGVEKHGDRADQLREEDSNDCLPPIETDSDHSRAQRPVTLHLLASIISNMSSSRWLSRHTERKSPVEYDIVPPSPGSLFGWCGIKILVGPRRAGWTMAMLIKSRIVYLDPFLESLPAGESSRSVSFLLSGALLESLYLGGYLGGHRVPCYPVRHSFEEEYETDAGFLPASRDSIQKAARRPEVETEDDIRILYS